MVSSVFPYENLKNSLSISLISLSSTHRESDAHVKHDIPSTSVSKILPLRERDPVIATFSAF